MRDTLAVCSVLATLFLTAFTFATAGFDTLNPDGFQGVSGKIKNIAGISPAVDGSYFTSDWALNTAVDSTTSGLIQTGIYGGNLGDNIGDSFKGSVVNEGTALGFNLTGTGKLLGELTDGSAGAVGLHALIGCASYAAQGADCAAGAVQAGGVEFYAGTLPHGLSKDEYMQQTHDAAVLIGVLTSKGDPQNIGRATGLAASAGENNQYGHHSTYSKSAEEYWSEENCANPQSSECGAAYDKYQAEQWQKAAEITGIAIDFVPIAGDIKGIVECGSSMDAATCSGVVLGALGPAGDLGNLVFKSGRKFFRFEGNGKQIEVPDPKGGTGNSLVDVFVSSRSGGNPRNNIDGEAGNPFGPQGRVFNAQEFDSFAPTLAQRDPIKLSDGSLIDNQGFVYTRNANGSVISRVASSDQLAQSGQRMNFDNISTANPRQSVTARNQNEQLALDQVRANPSGGQPLTGLNNDARFTSSGFEKMTQSVLGPSGKNINIHYQYNPATGRVVDVKINSPITNAQ